jgi:hypothetical protein
MAEPGDRLGLGQEAGQCLGRGVIAGRDHLERDQAVEADLARPIHHAHPAPADHIEDLIPLRNGAGEGIPRGAAATLPALRGRGTRGPVNVIGAEPGRLPVSGPGEDRIERRRPGPEAIGVLVRRGLLVGGPSQAEFQRQQLTQGRLAFVAVEADEVVLDPRPMPAGPLSLESIAETINAQLGRWRRAHVASRLGAMARTRRPRAI